MQERNCFTLLQNRNDSGYNNFTGKYYHFPKKYYKQLSEFENIEFVYYEPPSSGKGEYFGYGKIGQIFVDKTNSDFYYAEITDYKPFSKPVPFRDENGNQREFGPSYNAQNAVRKISPEILDEICLDGEILLSFKADAHLVQVLGEQLIASERVGILELVKNAFDAGASECKVKIEKVPGLLVVPNNLYEFDSYDGPVIVIEDNGSGMTKDQIELGWLRPASTMKTNIKERLKKERLKAKSEGKTGVLESFIDAIKSENKGRVPLGEKGVGRFACHRLGRKLIIKTKVAENNYEYVLEINWDDFNIDSSIQHRDLDNVKVKLRRQLPSRNYGVPNSGTQLIIYGGRDGFELTEDEIKEINRTILKLNSPNPNPNYNIPLFKAEFVCPQVKDLDEDITYQKFDPVFSIYGLVDEWGNFNYDYTFQPPYSVPLAGFSHVNQNIDLKTLDSENWQVFDNGKKLWRKPACGQFYFHLDVWHRDKPWIGNSTDERDFKKYLERYGGISIYRDGINVFPAEWGAETDWLGLRQRQIKQSYRMSYYHMIGNIEIDQSTNVNLIDKTNREGMLKNRAFNDLTKLTKLLVYFVENDYAGKRDEYNTINGNIGDAVRVRKFSQQSADIISNINNNYDVALDQYKLFENISELGDISDRKGKLVELSKSLKNLDGNLKQIQEVQEMLTEQAGFGLGIAVALHEITKTTNNFYYGILDVIENEKFDKVKLTELTETSKSLESELLRLSPLRALRNEEPITFKVSDSIKYVSSVFKRKLDSLGIVLSYSTDQDFWITARYGALNQILTNLVDNSCYWMDNPTITNRVIHININSKERTIIVADNGPGIHESIMPYLFQPGASMKWPPSGLGLYISKHYMNLMKKRGDIYLARESDRLNSFSGAQFLLDFSKVNDDHNG